MGLFDDDRFFREFLGGAFGDDDDDDDLLTFEEKELKEAGIDLIDFDLMADEDKKAILEENFLDPEDFRYMFTDDSILDDDDDTDTIIYSRKTKIAGINSSKVKNGDSVKNIQSYNIIESSEDKKTYSDEDSIIMFRNINRYIDGKNNNSRKKYLPISWLLVAYVVVASWWLIKNIVAHFDNSEYVELYVKDIFILFILLPIAMRLIYRFWYVNSSWYKNELDLHIGWTVALFYIGLILIVGKASEGDVGIGILIVMGDAIWFLFQVINYNTISDPKTVEEIRKGKRQEK